MSAPAVIATYPRGRATVLHLAELGATRTLCGVELGRPAAGEGVTRQGRPAGPDCRRCARSAGVAGPPVTRARLTSHQAEVWRRLRRLSARRPDGWVAGETLGSAVALAHLVDKGYAERQVEAGPRGGQLYSYRPVTP